MLPLQFRRCGAAEKKKKKRRAASSPVHAQRERGVCARKARQERSLPRERSSLVKNTSLGKVPSWGARNLRRKNVLWEEEESRRRRRGALFVVDNFFCLLSLSRFGSGGRHSHGLRALPSPPVLLAAMKGTRSASLAEGDVRSFFVFPFFRLLGTSDDLASPRLPPPSLTRQFLLIPPPPSSLSFSFSPTPHRPPRPAPRRGLPRSSARSRTRSRCAREREKR